MAEGPSPWAVAGSRRGRPYRQRRLEPCAVYSRCKNTGGRTRCGGALDWGASVVKAVKVISITMYTQGTGSGHLSRVNAVYRGFRSAGIPISFSAFAPRSKYQHLLDPGIRSLRGVEPLDVCDIFICDWRSDEFVASMPPRLARLWVGLKRLGTNDTSFPRHFHTVGLEPGVPCDVLIWPVLSTWAQDLFSRSQVRDLLNLRDERPIVLCCENGAYPKHLAPVFNYTVTQDAHVFRCSNAPYSIGIADLSYYPIARLFAGVDGLVLGGGYNSVHEALSYASLDSTAFVHVGGDDQKRRLAAFQGWEVGRGSRSHELALHLHNLLR